MQRKTTTHPQHFFPVGLQLLRAQAADAAQLAATFSADEFIEQLEAEHRIKPEVREGRGMGFLQ